MSDPDEEWLADLFRPRDRWDDGLPPETVRGTILAYYDAIAEVQRAIDALPRWKRAILRAAVVALRVRDRAARIVHRSSHIRG